MLAWQLIIGEDIYICTGWPKNGSHVRMIGKWFWKPVNEVRFFIKFECKISIRILSVGTTCKYSVYDVIRDLIDYCSSSFDMGKIGVYHKIVIKNRKKRKHGNEMNF